MSRFGKRLRKTCLASVMSTISGSLCDTLRTASVDLSSKRNGSILRSLLEKAASMSSSSVTSTSVMTSRGLGKKFVMKVRSFLRSRTFSVRLMCSHLDSWWPSAYTSIGVLGVKTEKWL